MLKSFVLLSALSIIATTSYAGWGIRIDPPRFDPIRIPPPRFDPIRVPTPDEVLTTIQKVSPYSPQQVECDRVRVDADRHRARLSAEIARDTAEIAATTTRIEASQTQLQRISFEEAESMKYRSLLSQFQKVGAESLAAQADLKAALLNLRSRRSDREFLQMVAEIESTSKNSSLQQLATLTKNYMNKTDAELEALLSGPAASGSMIQLAQIVAVSQSFVATQIGSLKDNRSFHEGALETDQRALAALKSRVFDDSGEILKQDARTACNFNVL